MDATEMRFRKAVGRRCGTGFSMGVAPAQASTVSFQLTFTILALKHRRISFGIVTKSRGHAFGDSYL